MLTLLSCSQSIRHNNATDVVQEKRTSILAPCHSQSPSVTFQSDHRLDLEPLRQIRASENLICCLLSAAKKKALSSLQIFVTTVSSQLLSPCKQTCPAGGQEREELCLAASPPARWPPEYLLASEI